MTDLPPGVRAPDFSEQLSIDAYKAASTSALASADGAADKIVTASFSIATAFGALVALVSPKDSTNPLAVVLPFILLAAAVFIALYEQTQGISFAAGDKIEGIEAALTGVIRKKQQLNWGALLALGLGIICAGIVIAADYRHSTSKAATDLPANVYLTASGKNIVRGACGDVVRSTPLAVRVDPTMLDGPLIPVDLAACDGARRSVVLPPNAIDAITLIKDS